MTTAAASRGNLLKQAQESMMEDIRLRMSLLSNPEWLRQMEDSHRFFESGGEGKTLKDLGWE